MKYYDESPSPSLPSDAKTAKHDDAGKAPLQWLPTYPLTQIAMAFQYGSSKYGTHNYQKGIQWSRLVGSILRHVYSFMSGEDNDPESGLPHLAHAGANIMMLIYNTKHHTEMDDRNGSI